MVDSKENYLFDLGVKGLNIQTVQQNNKQFLIRSEKICSNRWPQSMELTHANRDYFMDRANEKNFHSQVVMHNRNKQVSTANEWEFSMHCIKRINFVQVVSMVWRFYFIHTVFVFQRLEAISCPHIRRTIIRVSDWMNNLLS